MYIVKVNINTIHMIKTKIPGINQHYSYKPISVNKQNIDSITYPIGKKLK